MRATRPTRRSPAPSAARTAQPPSRWRRRPTTFRLEAPSNVHFHPPGASACPPKKGERHGPAHPHGRHHVWLVAEMLTEPNGCPTTSARRARRDLRRRNRLRSHAPLAARPARGPAGDVGRGDPRRALRHRSRARPDHRRDPRGACRLRAGVPLARCARSSRRAGSTRPSSTPSAIRPRSSPMAAWSPMSSRSPPPAHARLWRARGRRHHRPRQRRSHALGRPSHWLGRDAGPQLELDPRPAPLSGAIVGAVHRRPHDQRAAAAGRVGLRRPPDVPRPRS